MVFINNPIDMGGLPDAGAMPLQGVQKTFYKVQVIQWGIISFLIYAVTALCVIFIPGWLSGLNWITPVAIALVVVGMYYFLLNRSFPHLQYGVRERDIIMQRGWIIRGVRVCPFNRVQNCTVQSGLLERKFGLATLIIYTAGDSSADVRIPGLLQEEAEKLRHFILGKIHTENEEGV